MKYLIGFCVSLIVSIALRLMHVDLFFAGWISCISYYTTVQIYEIEEGSTNE